MYLLHVMTLACTQGGFIVASFCRSQLQLNVRVQVLEELGCAQLCGVVWTVQQPGQYQNYLEEGNLDGSLWLCKHLFHEEVKGIRLALDHLSDGL